MENKIHCTTGRVFTLVLFLFLLLFARGTAVQALEKVDPSQIRENNNLVLYHDSDSLRNIEVTGINGFKILDEYSTKKQKSTCLAKSQRFEKHVKNCCPLSKGGHLSRKRN